eukprot:4919675-Amphidinium_carterae.1
MELVRTLRAAGMQWTQERSKDVLASLTARTPVPAWRAWKWRAVLDFYSTMRTGALGHEMAPSDYGQDMFIAALDPGSWATAADLFRDMALAGGEVTGSGIARLAYVFG